MDFCMFVETGEDNLEAWDIMTIEGRKYTIEGTIIADMKGQARNSRKTSTLTSRGNQIFNLDKSKKIVKNPQNLKDFSFFSPISSFATLSTLTANYAPVQIITLISKIGI